MNGTTPTNGAKNGRSPITRSTTVSISVVVILIGVVIYVVSANVATSKDIENAVKNNTSQQVELDDLPEDYIPRKELEIHLEAIQTNVKTNMESLKSIDTKLDRLLLR